MKAYLHPLTLTELKTIEIEDIIDWECVNGITIIYCANGDHIEFPSDKCILQIIKVKDNE